MSAIGHIADINDLPVCIAIGGIADFPKTTRRGTPDPMPRVALPSGQLPLKSVDRDHYRSPHLSYRLRKMPLSVEVLN
jgi:hypothetical protein